MMRWKQPPESERELGINVQPGPIDTDMNPSDGDFAAMEKAGTALGRSGKPEEIVAALAHFSPALARISSQVRRSTSMAARTHEKLCIR